MNRRQRRRQAFTLLELMIVLVILVLLIAMVGPRILGSSKKADIKLTKIQIGSLEKTLNDYYMDMRSFPSSKMVCRRCWNNRRMKRPLASGTDRTWMPTYCPWTRGTMNTPTSIHPRTTLEIFPTSGRLAPTVKRIRMTISSTGGQVVARPEMKKASAMKGPSIRDPVRAAAGGGGLDG